MPQPLLKDRDRHSTKHAVASVGVAEGVGMGRAGSMPTFTAARFIDSPTHWRVMSSMGRFLSLEWNEVRSARLYRRSEGIGTSRPLRALFPGTSGRMLMTGGS